ncbi:hypothetical protein BH18ACI2_BH18ACI2_03900 [soil metagenome]
MLEARRKTEGAKRLLWLGVFVFLRAFAWNISECSSLVWSALAFSPALETAPLCFPPTRSYTVSPRYIFRVYSCTIRSLLKAGTSVSMERFIIATQRRGTPCASRS